MNYDYEEHPFDNNHGGVSGNCCVCGRAVKDHKAVKFGNGSIMKLILLPQRMMVVKPDYPRCETCKHWHNHMFVEFGNGMCGYLGDVVTEHDFGCVKHEQRAPYPIPDGKQIDGTVLDMTNIKLPEK